MKLKLKFTLHVLLLFAIWTANANLSVIVPKPKQINYNKGFFELPKNFTHFSNQNSEVSSYFADELKSRFGIELKTAKSKKSATIVFEITQNNPRSEAYTLEIGKNIVIKADSDKGLFYGVQSLLQLIRAAQKGDNKIVSQRVEDSPRFSWRAFMLDEARYFKGEKEVYRILDAMAELKLNTFHWHLTDDQGWRVESKKYPLLTQVGGKRADTQVGGWNSEKRAGEPHEGFYTQEQIKQIVRYAKERQIQIVPEIEMPGHATAAVAAYPFVGSSGKGAEVAVVFGKLYDVFNVTEPKVMDFLKDIVSEMLELFECEVIHVGGDEVRFDQWEQNPKIAAYKEQKGFTSFMDIQIEATNKMSQFIAQKGKSMMGWNEILGKNLHADDNISFSDPSQKIASNVIVHFWKGDLKEMASAAKDGYKMVNSYHLFTYLDYSYKTISLEKSYSFDPVPEGLEKEFHSNVIGSGCQMWSEWIPKVSDMHRQIFPRIAAYAEVGWTELENKDFEDFNSRLGAIVENWKKMGIAPAEL